VGPKIYKEWPHPKGNKVLKSCMSKFSCLLFKEVCVIVVINYFYWLEWKIACNTLIYNFEIWGNDVGLLKNLMHNCDDIMSDDLLHKI
jgi:hypothetical protein